MPAMEELIALVGRPVSEPDVQNFLAALAPADAGKEDGGDADEEGPDWLSNQPDGYQVRLGCGGRIEVIFFYVRPAEGFAAFTGELAHGLSPRHGRAEVRRRLGTPSRSGEAYDSRALGPQGAWDRFDSASVCLHVQYNVSGKGIWRVTAMAPDVAP
jgi:hypothetical protein